MPAWGAPQSSSPWGRSELEGRSEPKDITATACVEVCGNVFASGVYDKRLAVIMNLMT